MRSNCRQAGCALEISEKVEGEVLSPHHASVVAKPILLVIFPAIDIVMHPKTCSTHALIAGLARFNFRIQQAWEYLSVMNIGRGYCITTDESLVHIDADSVLLAIVIEPILFDPAGL